MSKLALCLVPLALTGCADLFTRELTFGDTAAATIDFQVDLTGECAGTGTTTDEHGGVSTWTKTLRDGEVPSCRIDLVWDGAPIDLAAMRADVVDACHPDPDTTRCDPDELALTLAVTLDEASFVAGAITIGKEDLLAMSGRATTGGALLFEVDRTTPLPLVLAADPAVSERLHAAYLAGAALPIHAEGMVELGLAEVARLQAAAPDGRLHVAFRGTLGGGLEGHLD